jgi:hypothetical protein
VTAAVSSGPEQAAAMPDDLYHSDILGWSKAQADRLRRVAAGERVNDVDWEHVIEEVEDVGRSELKTVRSLLRRAVEHALKAAAWPEHAAARKWRNEAASFLGQARQHYEPGMAQHLDLAGLYADALAVVRSLDMRRPGRRLPEAITLAPSDLADRSFGPEQMLARIGEALDAEGGGDA